MTLLIDYFGSFIKLILNEHLWMWVWTWEAQRRYKNIFLLVFEIIGVGLPVHGACFSLCLGLASKKHWTDPDWNRVNLSIIFLETHKNILVLIYHAIRRHKRLLIVMNPAWIIFILVPKQYNMYFNFFPRGRSPQMQKCLEPTKIIMHLCVEDTLQNEMCQMRMRRNQQTPPCLSHWMQI